MAKQFVFVQPVLPEQSSALTISFLWLSPCTVTSSVLGLTPGSSHPAAPWPRCSTWDPCPGQPLLGTLWPAQVKAKSSQESAQHSLEHLGGIFLLPLLTSWGCIAPLFHKLGGQPWDTVLERDMWVSSHPHVIPTA